MPLYQSASVLVAAAIIASCSTAPTIQVDRAVLTVPTRVTPASLYFTVRNMGAAPLTVIGVDVDGAEESTLQTTAAHRMPGTGADDPMVMLMPVDSIPVASGATQRFAPGGYVVVARRLATLPSVGDSVRFTVRLSNGATAQASARVLPYAALDTALEAPTAARIDRDIEPSVATGREVYLSNGCASCHGRDGYGDGPIAPTLSPTPRDFRSNAPYRNGSTVSDIAQTLATGIPNGGQMPLFAHLTDAERRALALYVLSLRRSPNQDITP
ncbi:MAG: copper chaperone PCu(A)C [Gemmatimonadaceae bacterium]|nr:copper chaperone PCu(A)C [Gemmatimonadaceae bacterium]